MAPALLFVVPALLAARRNVWLVDGNNLMAQRGVPSSREVVFDKLQNIERSSVFLVFDGREGEPLREDWDDSKSFCTVITGNKISADDYIIEAINEFVSKAQKVHVVTSDRGLRKRVLARKDVDGSVVNPVTFWRRYRPRLTGLKNRRASDGRDEPLSSK